MVQIINESRDAAFSLAAEEYILTNFTDGDYLMLWINDPCVVTGRFQNPYEELNVRETVVPVFRRMTGGGTVYHDTGNLNYTYITDKSENVPDYERYLTPVIKAAADFGAETEMRDGGALYTKSGIKLGGSAQLTSKGRTLHHGTVLCSSDLGRLSEITGHRRADIASKAIRSTPAVTGNLNDFARDFSISRFCERIAFQSGVNEIRELDISEKAGIEALAASKYRTWEWNFGRSPAFTIEREGWVISSKNGIILRAEHNGKTALELENCRLIPEEVGKLNPEAETVIFG